MKAVQHFSDEQLRYTRAMKPHEVVQFLEDFRQLHGARSGNDLSASIQINVRVPASLLRLFRAKAESHGIPYQSQIKRLMEKWVREEEEHKERDKARLRQMLIEGAQSKPGPVVGPALFEGLRRRAQRKAGPR